MERRLQRFIADDCWLLVAIATFALASLAAIPELEGLVVAISIVGWFLLTPILLFWGEEVAMVLVGDDEPSETESAAEVDPDPLAELKRRYAAGEIDDAEFERRLERLVAVDELPDDVFDDGADSTAIDGFDDSADDSHSEYEREREREHEYDRE